MLLNEQEYQDLWETHKTNTTADFKVRTVTAEDEAEGGEVLLDINFEPVGGEEEGTVPEERLHGGQIVTIGGIISECKTKFTRNDKIMAFVTLEDMLGSVEVIIFPKTYEQYRDFLRENEMVFITGRVDEEVDRYMKLLCEKIERFSDKPSVLWIRFKDQQDADASSADMDAILNNSDGRSIVKLYLNEEKKIITLPLSMSVGIDRGLLDALYDRFGRENVEVTYPKK